MGQEGRLWVEGREENEEERNNNEEEEEKLQQQLGKANVVWIIELTCECFTR